MAALLIFRVLLFYVRRICFYRPRLRIINEIINGFKHGRYVYYGDKVTGNDHLAVIIKALILSGMQIEKTINSQQDEIDLFHELYSNIVLSIESYLIVLDNDEAIIFTNQQFCKHFNFAMGDILGKKLDDIFYYVDPAFKDGIAQAKDGVHSVLKKMHLSTSSISITADVSMTLLGSWKKSQIVIILDNTNARMQKDYQLSLMNRIAKSMESGNVIERVCSTILTGITSGSGLGFNRAMLFLVDEDDDSLAGKMAIGPDSFEEAMEIWSSPLNQPVADKNSIPNKGKSFIEGVLKTSFPMSSNNLFVNSLVKNEIQHIYDIDSDNRICDAIRQLIDVKEFVIMPISAMNRPIGIIVVDNKFNKIPISDYNIELLNMFVMQAAFSIESYNRLTLLEKEMDKLKRKQDAIIESEKMAAVGRIAAHISHEIRNPLVTMGGYARRIMNKNFAKNAKENEPDIKHAVEIILEESERLEKILSNVMDFTRPSKHIKTFNDINEVISDTINFMHNYLLENKVNIIREKNEIPMIKSDFNQMKQVILNLMQNAIDAMPSGGFIKIITTYRDNSLTIQVQDNGTGFAVSDIDSIFEPFFTTKTTGIGLGLTNVEKIIKDHSGSIEAKNLSEGGAEFIIKLPV
ncbi:MAG: GAF domain-containing protein [Spirochaetia bacterium]|nr:GAF domain-containing protein [Spirochaetia bacterium]